jgi:hypothetical protein
MTSAALDQGRSGALVCPIPANESFWIAGLIPFCIGTLLTLAADYHWFVGQVGYLSGAAGLAYVIPRTYFGIKSFERKDVALDVSAPVS